MREVFDVARKSEPGVTALLQEQVYRKLETDVLATEQALLTGAVAGHGIDAQLTAVNRWMSARNLWQRLAPELRQPIAQHPSFRYLLHGIRRTSADGMDMASVRRGFAAEFASFVWAAACGLADGAALSVRLDYRGGLRCVPFRRYFEFGGDRANQDVDVECHAEGARFRFGDGLLVQVPLEDISGQPDEPPSIEEHGYALNHAQVIGGDGLCAHARDPWLRVRLTGTNQRRDGVAFLDCDDEHYSDAGNIANIQRAEDLIRGVWPEEARDIAEVVGVVVPFAAASNVHSAFTVSSRQGAVFIGDAPPMVTAEMLLHEKAHVKLRQLQKLDPLLVDPFDETLKVPVPWRPDPRPIPGIFEGLYVFTHVAEFAARHARASGDEAARRRHREVVKDLERAHDVIRSHANLTPTGAEVLSGLNSWMDELRQEA